MKRNHHTNPVEKDIRRYGKDVLDSELMKRAFEQTHHRHSTVGDHTFRVARASVRISHLLQKLHIPVDMSAVVVGSLCHDLGMIGRDEKYVSDLEAYRKHPADSAAVAKELVEDLPEKTEDIIRRHMWPMRSSRHPNSLEGYIVSTADKYSSVVDFVKGSRKKRRRTGKTDYGK